MNRDTRWQLGTACSTVLLTLSLAGSADDLAPSFTSHALRLAAELLDPATSMHRPPLTSDLEHARTFDPVLTRATAVWTHEALPSPPLTVIGGRVFTYSDVSYDPLDAPILKIRPIDDDQVVPFLVRAVITPGSAVSAEAALTLSIPAPPIFDPRIESLSAWVQSERAQPSIERSLESSVLIVRVPVDPANGAADPLTVIVEGELVIGPYRPTPHGRFAGLDALPSDADLVSLATLAVGRDVADEGGRERLEEIAGQLEARAASDAQWVFAVTSWVSSHLHYQESAATRSPIETLEDRSGDCDEYSTLTVALLRALGVPSRVATGLLYDLDTLAAHAWVEAALPTRDGGLQWFLADPTLTGATPLEDRKERYVHLKDRALLYPMRPTVAVDGLAGRLTTDILLNWRQPGKRTSIGARELDRFIDLVIETVDRNISRRAEALATGGLRLRRASTSIAGSPYLIVDRAIAEDAAPRIQLRLENEERLVLDLTAGGDVDLDSEAGRHAVERFEAAYGELAGLFFGGIAARHNLELVYLRNRHSDRLYTVSLRVGRYLVEHFIDRVLKVLRRQHLLAEADCSLLAAVAETSGGSNLYTLQELARTVRVEE